MARPVRFLITVEHANNRIPREWSHLFAGARDVLETHRGWDPGALPAARSLAKALGAPILVHEWSRLLVDQNRSLHNVPKVWSEWTKHLSREEKTRIAAQYHEPHRAAVRSAIKDMMRGGGRVLHIGVHTFTPIWEGEERQVDVGFLYKTNRPLEKELAVAWRDVLAARDTGLRLRLNAPYRGATDGLTTAMRKLFPEDRYVAMELELNHGWFLKKDARWNKMVREVTSTAAAMLAQS